ncbi:hypothetical protein E4P41_02795 [Geodermatophilus sp. DF01-2]|uniref:hypothetical protein n=1 Tax=Geodermatophilus sp. DF01-2 TaxID=2559610 RepID=UPI001073CC9B|nr:hypothetical protein [Geodermatophilus sp. DF01_2]TFV64178.1 hypothetical protein E4P41_02795 [Geodermatophilus sp. DF01_2]
MADRRVALGVLALATAAAAGAGVALVGQEVAPTVDAGSASDPAPTPPATAVGGPGTAGPAGTSAPVNPNPIPEDPADVATDTAVPEGVSVQITYATVDAAAGGVVVGGYVAGVIEDGGTCRLVLAQDGQSFSAESEGLADVSNTTCGQLVVPTGSLTSGTWDATLSYSSPAGAERAASTTAVEVP